MDLPDIHATDLKVSRIAQQDAPALTEFCVSCSAFFEMTEGKPGSQLIAKEILELLPPGKAARNKHLLGFSRDGSLVAVADLGEDYPNAHDWYVALLLVTPASRQVGLGSRIWAAIETWIRMRGGKSIRLIVQQQNSHARRFWEAHGFAVVDESTQTFPDRENRVWRMLKSAAAG
jgi:ribosomal protein S18 acetylase RimI-like enzyme